MSDTNVSEAEPRTQQNPEVSSALFAHLIMQQANMAMLMTGKAPHPETGQTLHDLEAAKLFIDTLEMLENKTRGNLSQPEQAMLNQTLMTVRMAFVEAANAATTGDQGRIASSTPGAPAPESGPSSPAPEKSTPPAEESHKKFTKKY